MSRTYILKSLISKHKYQLLGTYILFSIEMAALLLRPFFIGWAINDLLQKQYTGLLLVAAVQLVYIITGMIRHRYDTKTYTAMYTALITNFLYHKLQTKSVSALTAHSTLAREFINFLETDLVYTLEAMYNIIGALVVLSFYNISLVLPCLVVLVPVVFISRYYGHKMANLYQKKNDELERQVDAIASGNQFTIRKHFLSLRYWQIKISNQEAFNFGIMEVLVLVVLGTTLLLSTQQQTAQAGDLYAMYAYIQMFLSGLDTIPYVVERYSTLKDIARRINFENDDMVPQQQVA